MHFVIERHIAAPPEKVWPLVAIPRLMSMWSRAPVRSIAPGDKGHPGTTGALRVVMLRMGGRQNKLYEVVERGEAPHRVHYRLVVGYPVESHRGEVELRPVHGGTQLTWTVRARLGAGIDGLVGRLLHRELARSLDALPGCLGAEEPLPLLAPIEEASSELWSEADSVLLDQRGRASQLADEASPHAHFARIYALVTERLLEQARVGELVHTAWLLRLIPIFERYYRSSLEAFRRGAGPAPELHWARALTLAARPGPAAIGVGLVAGIRAHVEGDLGRSLAEVYARFYADDVDYSRFRADYFAMQSIFSGAAEAMLAHLPINAVPRWFRIARRVFPDGLLDRIRDRSFYDMRAERRRAFDDGARIAALLVRQKKSLTSRA